MAQNFQESLRMLESRLYMYTIPNLLLLCERLDIELAADDNVTRPALVKKLSEWGDKEFKASPAGTTEEGYKRAVKNFIDQLVVLLPEVVPPTISASESPKLTPKKLAAKKDGTGQGAGGADGNPAIQAMKLKNMKTSCICNTKGTKKDQGMWITCTNQECGARFHHDCMPWSLNDKHNFECPSCLILSNDPLNDVIGILVEPSILVSDQEYPFKLTTDQTSRMQDDPNVGVEIRTIKCDGEHFYEQTWPDKCTIKLNGELLKEVKPLHQNSSLKKRKDEKIFSRKHIRPTGNTLVINFANVQDGKNTKLKQDPKYVFVVVLVRRVSVEELSLRIRNMNTLSVEQCKEFIKEKFLQQRDLEINEIKVNLVDNISFTTIKHPARGLFCDHVPCFSLDYFLLSMENNYTRKWACPICKKRCNKFVVDSYIEKVVEQAMMKDPELENVFFLKNGDVIFKSDILENDMPKRDSSPPKPLTAQDKKSGAKAIEEKQSQPVAAQPRASIPKPSAPPKQAKSSQDKPKPADTQSDSLEVLSILSDDDGPIPPRGANTVRAPAAQAPPPKGGLGIGQGLAVTAKSKPPAPSKGAVPGINSAKQSMMATPAPQQVSLRTIVGDLGFKSQQAGNSNSSKPSGGPLGLSGVGLGNKPTSNPLLPWNKPKETQAILTDSKSASMVKEPESNRSILRDKLNQVPSKGYNILKGVPAHEDTNDDQAERGSNLSVPDELLPEQGAASGQAAPQKQLDLAANKKLQTSRVVQEEIEEQTQTSNAGEGLRRVNKDGQSPAAPWMKGNRGSGTSSIDEEPEEEIPQLEVAEMAAIISDGLRKEEPVLDRLINKNIQADQELKSDFELLHKLQTAIQRANDNIDAIMLNFHALNGQSTLDAPPHMVTDEDILRLTDQEKLRSKCIDLLHSFVLNRQKDLQPAALAKISVLKRYQSLMHSLEQQDYYFDEYDSSNTDTYLVKRKPRAPGADRDLLEGLLQHYSIGNDKRRAKLITLPQKYFA